MQIQDAATGEFLGTASAQTRAALTDAGTTSVPAVLAGGQWEALTPLEAEEARRNGAGVRMVCAVEPTRIAYETHQCGRRVTLRATLTPEEAVALEAAPPAEHSMSWTETGPGRCRWARTMEIGGLLTWVPCAREDDGAVLVVLS